MLSFLIDEGALTMGVMSGVFTTTLLNSLKNNVVEPIGEIIIPSNKLDENSSSVNTKPLRWKIFVKDLIIWITVMLTFYILWKTVLTHFRPPAK